MRSRAICNAGKVRGRTLEHGKSVTFQRQVANHRDRDSDSALAWRRHCRDRSENIGVYPDGCRGAPSPLISGGRYEQQADEARNVSAAGGSSCRRMAAPRCSGRRRLEFYSLRAIGSDRGARLFRHVVPGRHVRGAQRRHGERSSHGLRGVDRTLHDDDRAIVHHP